MRRSDYMVYMYIYMYYASSGLLKKKFKNRTKFLIEYLKITLADFSQIRPLLNISVFLKLPSQLDLKDYK